jgi:triosephosphate isomerase
VNPDNVKELMSIKDVDGALVGGASLDADKFINIIKYRDL